MLRLALLPTIGRTSHQPVDIFLRHYSFSKCVNHHFTIRTTYRSPNYSTLSTFHSINNTTTTTTTTTDNNNTFNKNTTTSNSSTHINVHINHSFPKDNESKNFQQATDSNKKTRTTFCTSSSSSSSYRNRKLMVSSSSSSLLNSEIDNNHLGVVDHTFNSHSSKLSQELLCQFEHYCHQIEQHYLFKKQQSIQTNPNNHHHMIETIHSNYQNHHQNHHQNHLHHTIETNPSSTIHRNNITIVVGMSGGVDSSLTACLLKEFGFNVLALHMRNWDSAEEDPSKQFCTFTKDWNDVKTMCDKYNIPLVGDGMHPVEFIDEYWNDVFERLLDGYIQGQTPNPDLFCNKFIKFDAMLKYAQERCGAHYIATGHYAQIGYSHTPANNFTKNRNTAHLLRAIDHSKDQSYFLAFVKKQAFDSSLFPLGGFLKTDHVRLLARDYFKFPNELWNRKDSVGICFIGKRKFKDFLSKYINITPGNIVSILDKETILGKHDGISFYTIGQGIGLSGMKDKWFVCEKDIQNNILYACPGNDHYSLMKSEFSISQCHWLESNVESNQVCESTNPLEHDYYVKVRYNQKEPFACSIEKMDDDKFKIVLKEEKARAIAPGQVAVLYKKVKEFPEMVCMGGGIYY